MPPTEVQTAKQADLQTDLGKDADALLADMVHLAAKYDLELTTVINVVILSANVPRGSEVIPFLY